MGLRGREKGCEIKKREREGTGTYEEEGTEGCGPGGGKKPSKTFRTKENLVKHGAQRGKSYHAHKELGRIDDAGDCDFVREAIKK